MFLQIEFKILAERELVYTNVIFRCVIKTEPKQMILPV